MLGKDLAYDYIRVMVSMAYKLRDFVELYSSIILSIIQGNDIISVAYIMQNIKPTSLGKKTKSESGLSLIKMFLFWPRSVIPFGHMLSINRIGLIVHELHFFLQSWNFWSISICIGAGMLVFYRILLVSSIESTFNNAISL